MFTLATGNTIQALATLPTAITYTITGDEKGTSDSFKVLAQGQLAAANAVLYTVPAATSTLVQQILMRNGGATANFIIAINGSASSPANVIFSGQVPSGGSAIYTADGWHVYDGNGAQLLVGGIGPAGATGATGATGPTGPTGATGAAGGLSFGVVVGNAGTATADVTSDTISITGIAPISTSAVDVPDVLSIAISPATVSLAGSMSASDKLQMNNMYFDAVADFGWVGDDATDNLAAYNAMFTALPLGATVFFPTGIYRVSNELLINADKKINFRGAGRYTTIIKSTNTTANIFNVTTGGYWQNSWSDLGFQSSVNKTAGACIAITLGQASTFPTNTAVANNIYRCWFTGNPGTTGIFQAINFTGYQAGNLSVISDVDISGFNNGGRGIFIFGSTINIQITNVTINGAATTTSACMEIQASGAVQVMGSEFIMGTNCLLMNAATQLGAQACYFTNCFFDQPSGSVIKFIGGFTQNRVKFTQCGIAPTGNNHAIEVNGTGAGGVGTSTAMPAGLSFVDCDIYSSNGTNTGAGVLVNGCQDINIQACRIAGFAGAGGSAIRVIGSALNQTKIRIEGNLLGPNSNLTVTNTNGVELQAGASALGALSITDNNMLGSTVPIVDASTVVVTTQKNISNNLGTAGVSNAISAVTAGITTTQTVLCNIPLPANGLLVGATYRATARWTQAASGTPSFVLRYGPLGTAADPGLITHAPPVITANTAGHEEIYFTVVGPLGAACSVRVNAQNVLAGAAPTALNQTQLSGAVNVNTTTANFLTLSVAISASTYTPVFASIERIN